MGKLKYSIVIPVYNKEKYLEECLNSILQQMGQNSELILIDDGSTDNSGKICDLYGTDHLNVKVIHQLNQGVSAARNNGIAHAEGKYLIFVDCDDTLEQGFFEVADKILSEYCDLFIFGMSFDYYKNQRMIKSVVHSYPEECQIQISDISDYLEKLFESNSLSSSCNKVFVRDIVAKNEVLFNDQMYLYEDLDFVLRYISCLNDKSVIYISNVPYYHYRHPEIQANSGDRTVDIEKMLKNLDALWTGFDQLADRLDARDKAEQLFSKLYLDLVYIHLFHTDQLKKSLKYLEDRGIHSAVKDAGCKDYQSMIIQSVQNKDTEKLRKYLVAKKRKTALKKAVKAMIGK